MRTWAKLCGSAAAIGVALAAALALAQDAPPPTEPDAALPKSLDQAVAMERADALPRTAFYDTPAGLAAQRPGALLRKQAGAGYALPAGARAVRILYRSADAEGRPVATSGVVLVPAGPPPAGGWPIIAWAHGTSGVARMCAPSLMKDVAYGEEGVMPMVRAGFAVVATDYHGLGTEGPHEYVSKLAQARDVINAIPAARTAEPSLGERWVTVGHSQGGLAAWGVAEQEAARRDPAYLGAIAVAPASGLTGLGAMRDAPKGIAFYLDYLAFAIHARWPGFRPADMLTGPALDRYGDVTTKGCWNYAYASYLHDEAPTRLKPGWSRLPAAQAFFAQAEIGHAPFRAPLLVIAGEADQAVPIEAVRAEVAQACRLGRRLQFKAYPGLDHDPVMVNSTPDQLAWIRARFKGEAAGNDCTSAAR
jgi:alpha-beta hydrolase superfamily lysophospholipase